MDTILHQIRLRGPWEIVSPNGELLTLTVPFVWRDVFGEVSGQIRCARKFNQPTGLEAQNRVVISIPEGCGKVSDFRINDSPVSKRDENGLEFDITEALQEFNETVFSIEFAPRESPRLAGGLWSPVLLKIF